MLRVMKRKERFERVLGYFREQQPIATTELQFASPFQLLVAVVLSAQCTDARVNIVTIPLFAKYPTPQLMAQATESEIFEYIHSISYPNSKSKYLVGLSRQIVERFGGEVPDNIEDLTSLPGVGRKTANVIQALVFGKAALAVDTHVFRVSHRLGLVKPSATTPLAVERTLVKHIPQDQVSKAHFWLLYYGRYTCTSRSPYCNKCKLTDICLYYRENHR